MKVKTYNNVLDGEIETWTQPHRFKILPQYSYRVVLQQYF